MRRTRRMSRELDRLDQVERVGDDDRGERRLRHQADERGEHEQRRERGAPRSRATASCVCAPAFRLTAVCVVPPPAGIAPNNPPATFAQPIASSSRFGAGRGSPGAANARAAAMLSVKLMSAMPVAAGHMIRCELELWADQ